MLVGKAGPIEIAGAKAGDMLSLDILVMQLEGLGFTALRPGVGMFTDWVRQKEFGHHAKVVEVSDGVVHGSDKPKIPVRPRIGAIGVAPVHGAVLTIDNGPQAIA